MNEIQLFSVKLPERPTGKAIAVCFDSLKSQIIQAGMYENRVTRIGINVQEKQIEIEVRKGGF